MPACYSNMFIYLSYLMNRHPLCIYCILLRYVLYLYFLLRYDIKEILLVTVHDATCNASNPLMLLFFDVVWEEFSLLVSFLVVGTILRYVFLLVSLCSSIKPLISLLILVVAYLNLCCCMVSAFNPFSTEYRLSWIRLLGASQNKIYKGCHSNEGVNQDSLNPFRAESRPKLNQIAWR